MFTRKDLPELKKWHSSEWYITNENAKKLLEALIFEWEKKPDFKLIQRSNT